MSTDIAFGIGLILASIGWLVTVLVARRPDEPRIAVVTPSRFDVDAACAELVSDDLLAVAIGAGVVPVQRVPGGDE